MEEKRVLPKQPFFVLATDKYSKVLLYKYGISHFYSFTKNEKNEKNFEKVVVIPDGCVDIIFCYSNDKCWATINGTVLKACTSCFKEKGYYEVFGIRFLPGVVPAGFSIKNAELLNKIIPLENVEIEQGFTSLMLSKTSFADRHAAFMEYYLKYYFKQEEFDSKNQLNKYLVSEMVSSSGMKPIAKIVEKSGYSDRYVNKSFKENFGIVPKHFAKIMRFQYMLDLITFGKDERIDFAELAAKLGYYDQPHMIKEFKDYTEITPHKYIKMMNEVGFVKRLVVNEYIN